MLLLDDAVCLGVVGQDMNVSNAIPIHEPVEGCNVRGAIVGNDLPYCSPSA